MNKKVNTVKNVTIAGVCLALALLLPFVTGQIPQVGAMLCPMHIPVLLCGFFVSWKWALAVGFTAPILRFAIFSMPPMPFGLAMAFELATYGLVASAMYRVLPNKKWAVYVSLIMAMVLGRVVWGAARLVIAGVTANPFTWQMFLGGALLEAIPGIVVQLILIPIIVMAVKKNNEV
ncbi:MAG: ECF transporter S component [Firmicutes bacterium]|nr:ECF transporter S component [Bacillota bacterium]